LSNVGGPNKLWRLWGPFLGWVWLTPRNKLSPRYHVEFGGSGLKRMGVVRSPKYILERWTHPLSIGHSWPPRKMHLPCVDLPPGKTGPSRSTFQGHSKSSEPTRIPDIFWDAGAPPA